MQTTIEVWAEVPGANHRYEVSSEGRVRSLTTRPRILTPSRRGNYLTVSVSDGKGGRRTSAVHTLVLAAFVGPRPEGLVVRHLDGNPSNNALSNLTYGTYAENTADSIAHGTNFAVHVEAARTSCPLGHPYDAENTYMGTQGRGKTGPHRVCRTCKRARDRANARDPLRREQNRLAAERYRERKRLAA